MQTFKISTSASLLHGRIFNGDDVDVCIQFPPHNSWKVLPVMAVFHYVKKREGTQSIAQELIMKRMGHRNLVVNRTVNLPFESVPILLDELTNLDVETASLC
mmetsp:Transcript_11335/g.27887  ORF Transcript_11335/g.27887 Transcript_11335/m.27887 type:complete len:102 (-) Transcript_11335:1389-1694(-)